VPVLHNNVIDEFEQKEPAEQRRADVDLVGQ